MARKVERTAPGSKLEFRVTYDSGKKKWTNDRPGDGKGDPDEKENLFDDLTVKRGIKRVQKAIGDYAAGDKGPQAVTNAVEAFEVYAGSEAAKTAIRAIFKAVRGKGKKLEQGASIAKDYVNRNRREAMNRKRVAERLVAIAESLASEKTASRKRKADYGDTQAYFNAFDFFLNAEGGRQLSPEQTDAAIQLLEDAVADSYRDFRKILTKKLSRHIREVEAEGLRLKV